MRVWSTGCSWTYGTGLKFPSEETYVSHITEYVFNDCHASYYKYSDAGHSNQYIFRTAIEIAEKMNKEEDVLLVQWSSPFRQEIVTTDGFAFYAPFDFISTKFLYGRRNELYNTLGPKDIDKDEYAKIHEQRYKNIVTEFGQKFMNETYMELMSYNMQISLYHLLKSMGIKSLQFYGWEGCRIKSKNIWNMIPENENFLKESFQSVLNNNGFYLFGNDHPDKQMHKLFSEFLLNKLKTLNYI